MSVGLCVVHLFMSGKQVYTNRSVPVHSYTHTHTPFILDHLSPLDVARHAHTISQATKFVFLPFRASLKMCFTHFHLFSIVGSHGELPAASVVRHRARSVKTRPTSYFWAPKSCRMEARLEVMNATLVLLVCSIVLRRSTGCREVSREREQKGGHKQEEYLVSVHVLCRQSGILITKDYIVFSQRCRHWSDDNLMMRIQFIYSLGVVIPTFKLSPLFILCFAFFSKVHTFKYVGIPRFLVPPPPQPLHPHHLLHPGVSTGFHQSCRPGSNPLLQPWLIPSPS